MTVSVLVPLHRSRPWVDVVSANLARLPDDVEIVLSDRSRLDDGWEVLGERHGSDPRVRLVSARDDPGWVGHYNALLGAGRGEYAMFLPQDDDFPVGYVPALAAALDAAPAALLAFGDLVPVGADWAVPPAPPALNALQGARQAEWLVRSWRRGLGIPFRGVFRRGTVVSRRLWIRRAPRRTYEDVYWVLALAACGGLVHVPGCTSTKRYHPASAHAGWPRWGAAQDQDAMLLLARYLAAARAPVADVRPVLAALGGRAVRSSASSVLALALARLRHGGEAT